MLIEVTDNTHDREGEILEKKEIVRQGEGGRIGGNVNWVSLVQE
jgi:hypothetical protein